MESIKNGIKEELKKLLVLQDVDCHIFDMRSTLEEIPVQMAVFDEALERQKTGMQLAESELKKMQVLKGEKETDIATKEAKVKKYQADLYSIKNNKEFQSLQQEISSIKADISVIEDSLISLFDGIESAKTKFEEERKIFSEKQKISDSEKETMKSRERELAAELKGLESKRDALANTIDPSILLQYNKILSKWGRTAVAVVSNEFCGECNMHLRPQIINESRLGKKVVLCENCSRILYAEN